MQEILLQLNVNSDKLLVVKRKPQQHTLSVRISEALRDYLERAREVIKCGQIEADTRAAQENVGRFPWQRTDGTYTA